jgi:hypothetical protein
MLRNASLWMAGTLLLAGTSLSAAPEASPAATAAPAQLPTDVIDAMSPADLQQAIQLLKSNYINPDALNETELNRATLAGVLLRAGPGVMLLGQANADAAAANAPLYAEVLEEHIGYVRLGALTPANLQALDTNLQAFAPKKVDALVLDLRASARTNDFAIAAEFAKRFVPKGKPIFTLRKPGARQERAFTSERDPAFRALMIVLADGDTSGPAEAIAGVLRLYNRALLIGQQTAGRAVEYSDLPLQNGRLLRVAVAEAVLPENRPLFPGGLKADLAVEMPPADKRLIFEQSVTKGMAAFVYESERPHLNEAALLAGKNPEIERRRRRGEIVTPTSRSRAIRCCSARLISSRRSRSMSSAEDSLTPNLLLILQGRLRLGLRSGVGVRIESARRTHRPQIPEFPPAGGSAHAPEPGARDAAAPLR